MERAVREELVKTLRRAGLLEPGLLVASLGSFTYWGLSAAAPYDAAAVRYPRRTALIDDYGELTYRRLRHRTDKVAAALRGRGIRRGDTVGIMCRNHRGFVEAMIAATKCGATVVYLNTGFAGPQLAEVVEREGISLVFHDRKMADVVAAARLAVTTVAAVPDGDPEWTFPDLDRPRLALVPPAGRGTPPVLLTSGTTGTPKGARRSGAFADAETATGLLRAIPYARGDVYVVAAPAFHAWGLAQLALAAAFAGTAVVRERFDAAVVLDDVVRHAADVLVVVPTMLTRLLAEQHERPRDLSSLRIVASSGSALPGDLARDWMDAVGDTLFNLYGSTEVGQATVATPADLRVAPGTAGRVLAGTTVAVLDQSGRPVDPGEQGEIYVGSGLNFDGYTGGGSKRIVDGLMSIGDVGYVDEAGRLFVTGRADDMIITGGENVYPAEIEDVLTRHSGVLEAAVLGVEDEDLGQRVEARVVRAARSRVSAKTLEGLVRAELAGYKVPRRIEFVDELPRNTTGKLLRNALS